MPIELFTGKPGNAKTAFLVDRMLSEKEKKNPRHLVAMGINGLVPGVADDIIDDPTRWSEITDRTQGPCRCALYGGAPLEIAEDGSKTYPPHTHRIPPGSLVFVDEAWKWFGHLQDARGQQTPRHALDLAEHRHMGIDFVWTAQGPNQIYPFVRNLIADHTHHVRRFGTQFVDTFKWEELQDDVKSEGKRAASLAQVKVIPKRTFGLYKSAQEHTIKRSIPWRVYAIPGLLIAAAIAGWLAYTQLRPEALVAQSTDKGPESASADPAQPVNADRGSRTRRDPLTPAEYAAAHLPRFPSMPHTAPVFDDRSPVSDPLLLCMSGLEGPDAQGDHKSFGCTCMTEQGTRYEIDEATCRYVARWGQPYNPYRQHGQPQESRHEPQPVVAHRQSRGEPPIFGGGEVGSRGRPAAYGEMRPPRW